MKRIELKKLTLETRDNLSGRDLHSFCVDHIEDCDLETVDAWDNDEFTRTEAYDALREYHAEVDRNGNVKIVTAYVLEFINEYEDGEFEASDYDWLRDYYWIDTEYNYGDFNVPKVALIRGKRDRFDAKLRDEEEVVAWTAYEDIGIEVPSGEDYDVNDADDKINDWIEEELYFLPEYEIN